MEIGSPLRLYFREIELVKRHWGWFLSLGILMMLFGFAAIGYSAAVTVSSVFFTGLLLCGSGIAQIIHALWANGWKSILLSIVLGLIYLAVGVICTTEPIATAISITLFIASFCIFAGIFKMFTALYLRFHGYGWMVFNGLITFLLGLMIVNQWPASGLWIIGLFIGVDLLLFGWAWILLALTVRR